MRWFTAARTIENLHPWQEKEKADFIRLIREKALQNSSALGRSMDPAWVQKNLEDFSFVEIKDLAHSMGIHSLSMIDESLLEDPPETWQSIDSPNIMPSASPALRFPSPVPEREKQNLWKRLREV